MLFDSVAQRQLVFGVVLSFQFWKCLKGIPLIFNGHNDGNYEFVIRWSLIDLALLFSLIKFRIARLSTFVKNNFIPLVVVVTIGNSFLFSGYLGQVDVFPFGISSINCSDKHLSSVGADAEAQIIGSKTGWIKEIELQLGGNRHFSFDFTPVCEGSLSAHSCVSSNTRPPNTQGLLDEQVILPNNAVLLLKVEGSAPFKVIISRNNSYFAEYIVNESGKEKLIPISKPGAYHIESITDSFGDKGISKSGPPAILESCEEVRFDGLFLSSSSKIIYESERIVSIPIWSLKMLSNDTIIPIEVIDSSNGVVHSFQPNVETNNMLSGKWIGYSMSLDFGKLYPKKDFIIKLLCCDSFSLKFIPNLTISLPKKEFEIEQGTRPVIIPFKIHNPFNEPLMFELETEDNVKSLHKTCDELFLNSKGVYKINYVVDQSSLKHPQNISFNITDIHPPKLTIKREDVIILKDDSKCSKETVMEIPFILEGNPPFRVRFSEDGGFEREYFVTKTGKDIFRWMVNNSPSSSPSSSVQRQRKLTFSSVSDSKFLTPLPLLPSQDFSFSMQPNTHTPPSVTFSPFKGGKHRILSMTSKNFNNPSVIEFKPNGDFPLYFEFELRDPRSNVVVKDEMVLNRNVTDVLCNKGNGKGDNQIDILKLLPAEPENGSYKLIPLSIRDGKGCLKRLSNRTISLTITSQKPSFSFVENELRLGDEDSSVEVPITYGGNGSWLKIELLNLSTKEIIPFNLPLPPQVRSVRLFKEGQYRIHSLKDEYSIVEDFDSFDAIILSITRDQAPQFTFKDGKICSKNIKPGNGKWIMYSVCKEIAPNRCDNRLFSERIFISKDTLTPLPLAKAFFSTQPGTYRHSIEYCKVVQDTFVEEVFRVFEPFLTAKSDFQATRKHCPSSAKGKMIGPFYLGGLEDSGAVGLTYSSSEGIFNTALTPTTSKTTSIGYLEFWIESKTVKGDFIVTAVNDKNNAAIWTGKLMEELDLHEEAWIARKGKHVDQFSTSDNSCIGDKVTFEVGGGSGPWKVSYSLRDYDDGLKEVLKGKLEVPGEKRGEFSLFLAKEGLLSFVEIENAEGCIGVPANLTEIIHRLPNAKIVMGSGNSKNDVWRGKKGVDEDVYFDIVFDGEGPFSVVYEKKNEVVGGSEDDHHRRSCSHDSNNEVFRLEGIKGKSHRVGVESSGTFAIKEVSDRWCTFPPKL